MRYMCPCGRSSSCLCELRIPVAAPAPAAPVEHRMLPGSHERGGGAECVCGAEWSRWDDACARQLTDAAAAGRG